MEKVSYVCVIQNAEAAETLTHKSILDTISRHIETVPESAHTSDHDGLTYTVVTTGHVPGSSINDFVKLIKDQLSVYGVICESINTSPDGSTEVSVTTMPRTPIDTGVAYIGARSGIVLSSNIIDALARVKNQFDASLIETAGRNSLH